MREGNKQVNASNDWAACLLVKDENLQLPEWLAYHYQVLPLRRIIVARDPRAKTDPRHILKQFEELGLEATVWEYDDYFCTGGKRKNSLTKQYNYSYIDFRNGTIVRNTDEGMHYERHLWRQLCFLTKCAQTLRDEGRTWTLTVDVDEFLAYNAYDPDSPMEKSNYNCMSKPKENRSSCVKEYHTYMQSEEQKEKHVRNRVKENQTIGDYLNDTINDLLTWDQSFERPCWVLPRIPIPAYEANGQNINNSTIHLNTLRFRYHAEYDQGVLGKTVLNLQRFNLTPGTNLPRASNCHKVYEAHCRGGPFAKYDTNVLRVHHYTGSLEDWLTRGKVAIGHHHRQVKNISTLIESHEATWWWPAFRQQVGTDKAMRLTKGLKKWAIDEYTEAFGLKRTQNDTLWS